MALTSTTEIPLGFKAPNFQLPDTITGKSFSFENIKGKNGTLVMFICNHCPYVIHVIDEIIEIAYDYQAKGIGFVAISSNDILNYPDDSPEKMETFAEENNFIFPYLYDESQEIAKAYSAECTPDFSLFDENDNCFYRGRLDGSSPGNTHPTNGFEMRRAIDCMIEKKPIYEPQYPSMGCGIKWKKEA